MYGGIYMVIAFLKPRGIARGRAALELAGREDPGCGGMAVREVQQLGDDVALAVPF